MRKFADFHPRCETLCRVAAPILVSRLTWELASEQLSVDEELSGLSWLKMFG